MTTWPDVGLALSGAPVGAAIALIGVHLTNRASLKAAREEREAAHEHEIETALWNRKHATYVEALNVSMELASKSEDDEEAVEQTHRLMDLESELWTSAPRAVQEALRALLNAVMERVERTGTLEVTEQDADPRDPALVAAQVALNRAIRDDLGLD
jgi:hypothetical protein